MIVTRFSIPDVLSIESKVIDMPEGFSKGLTVSQRFDVVEVFA
jgi:hypothetical protein